MPVYVKKPVAIEAMEFKGFVDSDLFDWLHDNGADFYLEVDTGELVIGTLEDGEKGQARHVASPGDFIIKGIRGEFYACKYDIFVETYDAA